MRWLAIWALLLAPCGVWGQGEGMRPLSDEELPPPPPPPSAPAGVLTKAPALLEGAPAPYPEAALSARVEGDVAMVLTVDATGAVTEVEVTSAPLGHGLEEAATAAARAFRFSPAEIDGQPATVRVPFTYKFTLPPPPPPPGRLVGRILDRDSGRPLQGVVVDAGGAAAETDDQGRFVIEGLPAGPVEVTIVGPVHEVATRQLTLAEGADATLDVALEPLPASAEIVVRAPRDKTSLTRRTLEGDVLRTVPGSFGDPLRAIQNLPGIQRSPYVLGVLLVRGSSPGDSAVFVDGHEIPIAYHFLGGPSVLPPEMLERIDFYPGNFSARFGRAIGGIIDVGTRRGEPKKWHGSVDVDLFDAGGYVEGPIGDDWVISVAARRSYIDGVLAGIDAVTDAGVSSVLPSYYDYQTRVDHILSKRHRLSLLVFGSEDHLTLLGDPGGTGTDEIGARIAFHRVKLDWHAKPSDGIQWTMSPVIGADFTTFDAGETSVDGTVIEYGLRFDLRLDPAKTLTLRTGLDTLGRAAFLEAEVPLRIPDYRPYPGTNTGDRETQPVERRVDLISAAVYAEAEWRPADGPVTLIPGARLDSYSWFGRLKWAADPRLNVRYQLTPAWVLKAGAGLFNQPPPEWRIDEEFGNPELDPEWAEHYGAGFEWQIDEALSLDVEGFYIARHDMAERSEDVSVSAGDGEDLGEVEVDLKRFENTGEGRAYGLELLLKHEVTSDFYGWISYTLSRSESKERPEDPFELTLFDQTHILTAVASYKLGSGWEAGARFRLVTGNPTTPIEGATFEGDEGDYEPLRGEINSARQTTFHQLDLRIEKTWKFTAWQLAAYLDVQNVYNANNPEFTAYDYRFREKAPVPGIPILPTFGAQGRF